MPQYYVDEDLALEIERLAKQKPFENLTFSDALRRVLRIKRGGQEGLDSLLVEAKSLAGKKYSSPASSEWVKNVPELYKKEAFKTWESICKFLKIDSKKDSARRCLKSWVELHRPNWPEVPDLNRKYS